jgi:hypothetical protein
VSIYFNPALSDITNLNLNQFSTTKNETAPSAPPNHFAGLPQPFQQKVHTSVFPYIQCNEEQQEETLAHLCSHPSSIPLERRVQLGFSVWFNFDLAAASKPYYMICCDRDNHVMKIYQGIASSLSESESPQEFVTNFKVFLLENAETFFGNTDDFTAIFDLAGELTRKESWLSDDRRFQIIKTLHREGRITYLNLDITDETEFANIRKWLTDRDLQVSTLYVSNIIEWLDSFPLREAYCRNLKLIASPATYFIQAYKLGGKGGACAKSFDGRDGD